MQFFGDKYGEQVRLVQIGGQPHAGNGYSMELCGGTHVRSTGEIGLFRIVSEGAVAAGIRRIEALAGLEGWRAGQDDRERLRSLSAKLNAPVADLEKKLESVLTQQKELEKVLKVIRQREANALTRNLLDRRDLIGSVPVIIADLGEVDGNTLQSVADALKSHFDGVVVLGGAVGGSVALVATVGKEYTDKIAAGKIIQSIAPVIEGKGGGRAEAARGAGKVASKLNEALEMARQSIAKA